MRSRLARSFLFLSAVVCFAYAVAHAWWAVEGAPAFMERGESVFFPGGWVPVVPAALAAAACLLMGIGEQRDPPAWARWLLAAVGAVTGAAMVLYCFLFWISFTMVLMVPFGLAMSWADFGLFLIRAAGVLGGVLTLCCARMEFRRVWPGRERCGRVHGRSPERRIEPSPWWAYAGAYLAVAGTAARLSRLFDRWTIGEPLFDGPGGVGFKVFVGLMLLAGTVLPLALAHRWGRIWPGWAVPWAGRNVPRWLVLGPGLFMGVGLGLYFGVFGITAMATGDAPGAELEIAGYTAWGLGLLLASASYYRLTKPECLGRAGHRPNQ